TTSTNSTTEFRDPALEKLGARRLTSAGFKASWSPNGTRIAYSRPKNRGIEIVEIATGAATSLTALGKDPAWSPDGASIAYVEAPDSEYQDGAMALETVWVVPASGGEPRFIAEGGFPIWSK